MLRFKVLTHPSRAQLTPDTAAFEATPGGFRQHQLLAVVPNATYFQLAANALGSQQPQSTGPKISSLYKRLSTGTSQ